MLMDELLVTCYRGSEQIFQATSPIGACDVLEGAVFLLPSSAQRAGRQHETVGVEQGGVNGIGRICQL